MLFSDWECCCVSFSADNDQSVLLAHVVFSEQLSAADELASIISAVLRDLRIDPASYRSVYAGIINDRFALVPENFDETSVTPLFDFTNGQRKEEAVMKQRLADGTTFVFAMPLIIEQALGHIFHNVKFLHSGICAIQFRPLLTPPDLYAALVVHKHYLEVAIRRQQQLVFYNAFSYETIDDVLYYVLYVSEQYQLDPALHTFYLAMNAPTDSEMSKLLKKYMRNISFMTDGAPLFKNEAEQLPGHYFFTLKALKECAL